MFVGRRSSKDTVGTNHPWDCVRHYRHNRCGPVRKDLFLPTILSPKTRATLIFATHTPGGEEKRGVAAWLVGLVASVDFFAVDNSFLCLFSLVLVVIVKYYYGFLLRVVRCCWKKGV